MEQSAKSSVPPRFSRGPAVSLTMDNALARDQVEGSGPAPLTAQQRRDVERLRARASAHRGPIGSSTATHLPPHLPTVPELLDELASNISSRRTDFKASALPQMPKSELAQAGFDWRVIADRAVQALETGSHRPLPLANQDGVVEEIPGISVIAQRIKNASPQGSFDRETSVSDEPGVQTSQSFAPAPQTAEPDLGLAANVEPKTADGEENLEPLKPVDEVDFVRLATQEENELDEIAFANRPLDSAQMVGDVEDENVFGEEEETRRSCEELEELEEEATQASQATEAVEKEAVAQTVETVETQAEKSEEIAEATSKVEEAKPATSPDVSSQDDFDSQLDSELDLSLELELDDELGDSDLETDLDTELDTDLGNELKLGEETSPNSGSEDLDLDVDLELDEDLSLDEELNLDLEAGRDPAAPAPTKLDLADKESKGGESFDEVMQAAKAEVAEGADKPKGFFKRLLGR